MQSDSSGNSPVMRRRAVAVGMSGVLSTAAVFVLSWGLGHPRPAFPALLAGLVVGAIAWWLGPLLGDVLDSDWTKLLVEGVVFAVVVGGVFSARENRMEDQRATQSEQLENVRFVRTALIDGDPRLRSFRQLDLRGAPLAGLDLGDSDLQGAQLQNADLVAADLRNADLSGADLRGADLTRANLALADIRGANLRGATMVGVFLGGTVAEGTDMSDVDLSDATVEDSVILDSTLDGADLSDSKWTTSTICRTTLLHARDVGGALQSVTVSADSDDRVFDDGVDIEVLRTDVGCVMDPTHDTEDFGEPPPEDRITKIDYLYLRAMRTGNTSGNFGGD